MNKKKKFENPFKSGYQAAAEIYDDIIVKPDDFTNERPLTVSNKLCMVALNSFIVTCTTPIALLCGADAVVESTLKNCKTLLKTDKNEKI